MSVKPIHYGNCPAPFSPFDHVALAETIRRVAHPGARMAEIGSWLGTGSTRTFIETLAASAPADLLCVDTWEGTDNVPAHPVFIESYDALGTFRANLANIVRPGVAVRLFVGSSASAADVIADGVFDLVFIDADHRYRAISADIAAWRPKVRSGGLLCGHDCETRLMPDWEATFRSAHEQDYLPIPVERFELVHPGVVLVVHEQFKGEAHLYAEHPPCLPDGTAGGSSIWVASC